MATVEMSRIRLIGLNSEKNSILSILERSRSFEIIPTADLGAGSKRTETSHLDKVVARRARINYAIEYLLSAVAETKKNELADKKEHKKDKTYTPRKYDYQPVAKKGLRREMGYDDFYDVSAKEYELLNVAERIERISITRVELRSKIAKLHSDIKNLSPYVGVEAAFSEFKDTKNCFCTLFSGPKAALDPLRQDGRFYVESFHSDKLGILAVIGLKEDKQHAVEQLSLAGFSAVNLTTDSNAKELIASKEKEIAALEAELESRLNETISLLRYLEEMKVLYDILSIDIEKSTAELEFVKTASTFCIEGWAPAECAEIIVEEIRGTTDKVVCYMYEPTEKDTPPTMLSNPKPINSFEDVTNMYSAPKYGELDPNPVMAIFFFIFFGLMLGDAGYGLILSIVCFLAVKFLKLEKGMHNMLVMFGICGISAIIWGLIMGGVFSIPNLPALISPLNEPVTLLIVAIALGIVHLSVGYVMNMIKKIRAGKVLDGILDNSFILLIFIGVVMLALGLVTKIGALSIVAMVLFIVAAAGIILTGGRKAPKIGGKIAKGFAGLYDLINLFSDVLSYCRLFGLALASGAIGMAFNQLGLMVFNAPGIGYVLGPIVLIVLHAFNMALSLLSAYVHNIRLQYLEFYGKFYEGDGRLFSPLGQKTKYVRFG